MLIKNLKGIISFEASGFNAIDFINSIKDADILCFNIKISENTVYADVFRTDFKVILRLSKKCNMCVKITRKNGIIFKALKYKKRYGIIPGLIVSLGLMFYMSNIVLRIEIQGNKSIPAEKIIDSLSENGITYGTFIPKISFKEVERNILTSFKDISWNSIRHSGGRIIIEIDEAVEPIKIVPDNIPCNIISTEDAQIISTEAYSGFCIRQVGDVVKKGDMLVSGMQTDLHGKSTIYHSSAKIIGRYNKKIVFKEELSGEYISETGNKEVKNYINFFGYKIPLFFAENNYAIPYVEEEQNNFELFGYTIPLGIFKQTYYDCQPNTFDFTKEEISIKIDESISNYENEALSEINIVSKEVQEVFDDNSVTKIILYILEGDIGTQALIAESNSPPLETSPAETVISG